MKKVNLKLGHKGTISLWNFENMIEFNRDVEELAFCWRMLESMGMQISALKCQAVFTYRGTLSEQIRRKYTRKTEEGRMFRFCIKDRLLEIPMKQQTTYLGTIIS